MTKTEKHKIGFKYQSSKEELNMAAVDTEMPELAHQLFFQLQALSNKVDVKLDSVVQSIKTLNKDTWYPHWGACSNMTRRSNNFNKKLMILKIGEDVTLRLLSIQDGYDGGKYMPFMEKLLCHILGWKGDASLEVEHAH